MLRSMPTTGASSYQAADVTRRVVTLQRITIAWMCVECGVAVCSAWRAHSVALLAFGADSFVNCLRPDRRLTIHGTFPYSSAHRRPVSPQSC